MSDEQNPPTNAEEIETPLEETSDDLATELSEMEENYKRAVADLANFRRQAEEDKQNFAKYAAEKTVLAMLPILGNLQRANAQCPADIAQSDFCKGISAIEAQFEQALGSVGVTAVDSSVGAPVDPTRHQVIGTGAGELNTILECFEPGFELGGKVIQLAKVRAGSEDS